MEKHMKGLPILDAHFKEWQELSTRLRAQMSPALEVQEALRKSMQPIIEAQNSLEKALEPILAQQESWKKRAESVQLLAIQATDFQKSIQRLVTPAFEPLQKTFRELPTRTRKALLLLGEQGWYLDLEMSIPGLWQLKDALAEGNVTEAEEALVEYFESRLSEIEQSITARFPHREHLIRAAFNAHRRQEYALAIPVLLAQTDGICKEVSNQYLFMKQNKRPRTAIYVDQIVKQIGADSFAAALLSPLAQTLPINASESERPKGANALNRHAVLHGESLNYGSKINSLKAISLLNYVAHVLEKQTGNP
ncbi:MAG: hypothetical protein C4340_03665 [Armatimonadota bacterium]